MGDLVHVTDWQKKYGHIVLKEIPGCQQSTYHKKIMKQTKCPDCLMKMLNGN